MNGSIRLGSIRGVDIGLHYSWFLVFLLVAWTLAAGLFPEQYPGLSTLSYWAMGFSASLLLFVSVLAHELAHSFAAEARGLSVGGITLFVFGGISNITEEPRNARDELMIAAVGPICSLAIGVILWAVLATVGGWPTPVEAVLLYLAGINILLAIFNLIPGFPLDGGRVLRAVLWMATNSLRTATRIAAGVGHAVAMLFIFGGLLIAFTGSFISGMWLLLIGWFLDNAATASSRQAEVETTMRGVTVREVMNPHPFTVGADASVFHMVHDYVLQKGVRALPVVQDGRLLGMVTVNEVRQVPRDQWHDTPVSAIMIRVPSLRWVRPGDDLSTAVSLLAAHDVNQLPVIENHQLVGLLSRSHVIRFLQVREELGIESQKEEGEEERRRAA